MTTTVNYTPSTIKPTVPNLAVGQFWKRKTNGDLYLICGDGQHKYWAVCVAGEDASKIGDTYEYLKTNVGEVLDKDLFEFVPTVSVTIP